MGFKFGGKAPNATVTASSAGCLGIFGALFAAMGVLFTIFIAKDFFKTVDARGWDKVPATLAAADIEVSQGKDEPFAIRARYSYRIDGREYASDRYALKESWGDDYEKLALKVKALRARTDLVAFVDPADAASAVLEPGSIASGFLILFPLVFVLVGAGIIYAAVRMGRHAKKLKTSGEAISSSPTKRTAGAAAGIMVGAMFAAFGVGLLYPLGLSPISRSIAAKNWVETPCKIIWARVKSHDSDDGTTYSVDIFYSYQFNGQEHRSNRYGFMGGSSSGQKPKRELANRYRKAKAPVCYVDPDLPERAVLKRDLGAAGLFALIPFGLLLIGVPLTVSSLRHKRKQSRRAEGETRAGPFVAPREESSAAAKTFSPGKSRLTSAIVLLLLSLFWNGLVFGFLFREAWLDGGGLFLKLFSIPFILVGVLIALGFFYTVLAIFNPQPIVQLEPGEPQLGVPATLRWHFKRSSGRLRRLQIILSGRERASYQRGTDTVTDEGTFYAVVLTDQSHAMAMHRGTVEFTIPADLMYSLELANNAILWRIEVRGEVPFWPDLDDKFDIEVRPQPLT